LEPADLDAATMLEPAAAPHRDHSGVAVSSGRRRSGMRRPRAIHLLVTLLVLALATVSVAGVVQWRSTKRDLAATEQSLINTRKSLDLSEQTLGVTKDKLKSTQDDLTATTSRLTATESQLQKSRDSLNSAHDRLDLQASQIDTLQTCLNGVVQSLRYAAGGSFEAALSTLQQVDGACTAANEIL
jgi:septal ring factor EnvC (AmiA/AmiB activator)